MRELPLDDLTKLENSLSGYTTRVARMLLIHEFEQHGATVDDIMNQYAFESATSPTGTGIYRSWVEEEYEKWAARSCPR